MARSYGKVLSSVWTDRDWIALTVDAQHAYMQLLSQPRMSLCGSLDLIPKRWAAASADGSLERLWSALRELEARRFIVLDEDTDELLVRTVVVHDLDPSRLNRNTLKGLWSAWSAIASETLRKVVVDTMPDAAWEKASPFLPGEAKDMRAEPPIELPVGTGVPTPDPPGSRGRPFGPGVDTPSRNGRSDARSPGATTTDTGHETAGEPGWNGRSDDQSEPPVGTTSSDGQIEPPVSVSCLLSPVSAAADASRAELPPEARTPAAATHPQADTRQGRDTLIAAAAKVIARRRAQHRPDVGEGWVHNAAQGIADERRADAEGYLLNLPDGAPLPTPEELAEILEPSQRPIDLDSERGRRRSGADADHQAATRSRIVESHERFRESLADAGDPPDEATLADRVAAARAALPATSLARAQRNR